MSTEVVSTSAVTAEVASGKPAVVSGEKKLTTEIKTLYNTLEKSDADWAKNGLAFGKKVSEWRKKYSKQGSRKGHGFAAFCEINAISYRKARYWADHYDNKTKPQYVGGESVKTTTEAKKGPKPTAFVLTGLNDSQHEEIRRSVNNPESFSLFVYQMAVNPGDQQVRDVVKKCLGNLYLNAQASFLTKIRDWIDGQIEDLKNPVGTLASNGLVFLNDEKPVEQAMAAGVGL